MKNMLILLVTILSGIGVTAQQLNQQDILRKSKNQKIAARILTAGGGALLVGGMISYTSESTDSYFPGEQVGTILMAAGAAAITGGIILFSASKKNEKKANELDMSLRLAPGHAEVYQRRSIVKKYYPAVSLQLRF